MPPEIHGVSQQRQFDFSPVCPVGPGSPRSKPSRHQIHSMSGNRILRFLPSKTAGVPYRNLCLPCRRSFPAKSTQFAPYFSFINGVWVGEEPSLPTADVDAGAGTANNVPLNDSYSKFSQGAQFGKTFDPFGNQFAADFACKVNKGGS